MIKLIFYIQYLKEVLEQLLEPPEEESILTALKRLQDLGALDEKHVRYFTLVYIST